MAADKGGYGREIAVGSVTAVVVGVVTAIAAYMAPGGFAEVLTWPGKAWHWLAAGAGSVWDHFSHSTPTPNWLLYVLGLAAVAVVCLLVAFVFITISSRSWRSYVEDTFDGVLWRWRYVASEISDLRAYCIQCDGSLVAHHDGFLRVVLHCEHCGKVRLSRQGTLVDLKGVITRRIDRKLRTEEWRRGA